MDDSFGTRLLLTVVVIVVIGPIDMLGFAPGTPELTLIALAAVWGLDLEGDTS